MDSTKNFAIIGPDTPVFSDQTMTYLSAVRDPPGGSSSKTFNGGKLLSFDMSVDQLETLPISQPILSGEEAVQRNIVVGITETGVSASDGVESILKQFRMLVAPIRITRLGSTFHTISQRAETLGSQVTSALS